MNIAEKLDLVIKLNEKGTVDGGYVAQNAQKAFVKASYMTKTEWDEFERAMKENKVQPWAHGEYGAGGGDELSEKNGRPPKMASYGSSSRMIYCLSRDKEGFHYEKKLPTTVGGTANLDGFFEEDGRYVFVEAKCREPYTKKNNSVSKSYRELYEFINLRMAGSLEITMTPSQCGRYVEAEYFAEGEKLHYFDLKQMICHLLGIATGLLKGTLSRKQTDFIYLLYDPTELDISPDAKEEIDRIYAETCRECNLVDFAELFRTILEYLIQTRFADKMTEDEVEEAVIKFTFTLASQGFYRVLIR